MNTTEAIRQYIKSIPRGRPFTTASLNGLASSVTIRQALCRFTQTGEITRVARGVFVREKKVPYLGSVLPETLAIAEVVAQSSGETIAVHGAEAARILHLSTQVPLKPIFYTTGNTRHIKMGNKEITLKHISARKLIKPGTTVGLVISALWYLGKDHVNTAVIEKIKKQIEPQDFSKLLNHISQMPAWMAHLFLPYRKKQAYAK